MAKDEQSEGADLSQENGSDGSAEGSQEQQQDNGQQEGGQQSGSQQEEQSQEDYRSKLNITNRFLEKEGYVFNKDSNRWEKKAATSGQAQQSSQQQSTQAAPTLSRDEGILFAKGFSEAEVEQAKKVATLQGVRLTDAVADPLFTGWKAIEDKKAKDTAAQLGVSRGAKPTTKKTLATPGLSEAEHRELAKEKLGL